MEPPRPRRPAAAALLAAVLVAALAGPAAAGRAGQAAYPLAEGARVPADRQAVEVGVCSRGAQGGPAPGGAAEAFKLADSNYRLNGGRRTVTVLATYYTGCNPGRGDSPSYGQQAEALRAVHGDAVQFYASLKGGVNDEVCRAWAGLPGSGATLPVFLNDRDKALHYTFFTSEHPAYVVLDHCLRVRKKLFANAHNEMRLTVEALVAEAAAGGECPAEDAETKAAGDAPAASRAAFRAGTCVPELGGATAFGAVLDAAAGAAPSPAGLPVLANPRDLAFNPRTGELLVANNDTEAVSVLFGGELTGSTLPVRAITRRDTAYYHYMARVSSVAFDRDGVTWATCQESENTYDDHDVPNYFMGPTLYDEDEASSLRTAAGGPCTGDRAGNASDVCFLIHTDMLHESPLCTGIAHDPEPATVHGNVFWAVGARFDPTDPRYDGETQTLLRYDFEKPHGPGSLDHSLATVRRFHDVLMRRVPGVPSHLAVDEEQRVIYVADPGNGRVLAVDADSGRFERHAREDLNGEFKLWSATEPAFEYSVYNCTRQMEFATGLDLPSGLALSKYHVFVGEHATGLVKVFDKATGALVRELATPPGLQGLELRGDTLYYVHGGNHTSGTVSYARAAEPCDAGALPAGDLPAPAFPEPVCGVPSVTTLGNHINHTPHDCGYLNQTSDMCLGEKYGTSREVCVGHEANAFNYDMLLMTGFRCHRCLPNQCANGGQCQNLWSQGFNCTCPEGFGGDVCQIDLTPPPEPEPEPEEGGGAPEEEYVPGPEPDVPGSGYGSAGSTERQGGDARMPGGVGAALVAALALLQLVLQL